MTDIHPDISHQYYKLRWLQASSRAKNLYRVQTSLLIKGWKFSLQAKGLSTAHQENHIFA